MSGDLLALEEWYQLCQDRKEWAVRCREGVNKVASCRKKNTCAGSGRRTRVLASCRKNTCADSGRRTRVLAQEEEHVC